MILNTLHCLSKTIRNISKHFKYLKYKIHTNTVYQVGWCLTWHSAIYSKDKQICLLQKIAGKEGSVQWPHHGHQTQISRFDTQQKDNSFCGPRTLLFSRYQELFPWIIRHDTSITVTTYTYLIPGLRMNGAELTNPLQLHAWHSFKESTQSHTKPHRYNM